MIEKDELTALVMKNFAIPVRFANQRFLLDGAGVLFWPQHDLLVFSDLHFEKGSFLTQFAHPLPRFDTHETIKRMELALQRYQPQSVICLGDSFHDGNAIKRMPESAVEKLNQLINDVGEWIWVLGNHDPEIPESLLGLRMNFFTKDQIVFVHEPESLSEHKNVIAQVIGHYHPKASTKVSSHKITGKCFLIAEDIFFMPAFGKYAGGLSIQDEAIKSLISEQTNQVYLSYNKKLFMV